MKIQIVRSFFSVFYCLVKMSFCFRFSGWAISCLLFWLASSFFLLRDIAGNGSGWDGIGFLQMNSMCMCVYKSVIHFKRCSRKVSINHTERGTLETTLYDSFYNIVGCNFTHSIPMFGKVSKMKDYVLFSIWWVNKSIVSTVW